ncbi:MAG: hypothetical protein HUJ71_05205 [Pseudobutyrivibrio sp.]|nr:hypothetical protein [Pseudobutyrivibrio sp.]
MTDKTSSGNGMRSRATGTKAKKPLTPQQKEAIKKQRKRRALRNRIIFILLFIAVAGTAVFFINKAIQEENASMATVTTLTINEDGSMKCEEVVEFDESKYDKKELKASSKELIKSYNETVGYDAVKLDKIRLKDGIAYMRTIYSSVDDYATFTSTTCYNDSVESAIEVGYDFIDSYCSVLDGVKSVQAEITSPVFDFEGCKALVIQQNITVVVPGDICYISTGSTDVIDSHTVTISSDDGNQDATTRIYIIYK